MHARLILGDYAPLMLLMEKAWSPQAILARGKKKIIVSNQYP